MTLNGGTNDDLVPPGGGGGGQTVYGRPDTVAGTSGTSNANTYNVGGAAVTITALTPTISANVNPTIQFRIRTFTGPNGTGTGSTSTVGCDVTGTTCASANTVVVPANGSFNVRVETVGTQNFTTATATWVITYQ